MCECLGKPIDSPPPTRIRCQRKIQSVHRCIYRTTHVCTHLCTYTYVHPFHAQPRIYAHVHINIFIVADIHTSGSATLRGRECMQRWRGRKRPYTCRVQTSDPQRTKTRKRTRRKRTTKTTNSLYWIVGTGDGDGDGSNVRETSGNDASAPGSTHPCCC